MESDSSTNALVCVKIKLATTFLSLNKSWTKKGKLARLDTPKRKKTASQIENNGYSIDRASEKSFV